MNSKILKRNTFHRKSTPFLKTYFLKEENAINLIDIRRDKLILNEEALKLIKDIKENIIIVSIFGKGRTGKSYLMNLLLNSDENASKLIKGFKVTSQQNSLSRGIYLWNTPIEKPNSKEKILFLDSEGLNSENVYQQETDSKLLALILIISSLFIYNTTGDINSNSLNELELIVHLSDSFGINEKVNKDKLIAELCPKFIWTIRDFELEKLNEIKKTIGQDAYLAQCLKERFGGKNKDEINVIKENLVKYFKQRECVTLPKPVEEEKDLIILKKLSFNELQEDFRNEFWYLKDKIYKSSKAKIINGKIINGPIIAYLLSKIVNDINDEKIPNLSDIFNEMILYHIENSYNHAKNIYKDKLDKLKSEEIDLDIKEIYSIEYEALKEYMNILEKYPEISKKDIYLKEYNLKMEKLEKDIETLINKELNMLIANGSYEDLYSEKSNNKEYIKSDELIEDYLNGLSELKINSDTAILNDKDFDNFIKNDIKKTKDIIDFMEKNNEFSSQNKNELTEEEKLIFKTKETNGNNSNDEEDIDEDKEYENLKKELEDTERNALELIGKFTKLLDKRDKYVKHNNFRPASVHYKHNIKSYSSKLVNIYYNEDKLCELSSEEKPTEKCNCSMEKIKSNCIIY